jgi:hypothetical protein
MHEICAEQGLTSTGAAKDLGEDLLGEGAYWMGVQQLGRLYFGMCGVLDQARLASCAGQGRHGSPLHVTPARLTEDDIDVDAEVFHGSVRRWLGIPPPGIMDLQVCGACTQTMAEGRDDGPGERAAHLATCNSANKDETAQRGAHTTYHTAHTELRDAVRKCGEEALGKDHVEIEQPGMVEGSQQRPGDVVLLFNGNKVAVDVTIPHIQTMSNMYIQANHPGKPVMDAERAKRNKYAGAQFRSTTRFVPFVVDEFGHIGDAGWALLDQLAAHKAAQGNGRESEAFIRATYLQKWQHRITQAIRASINRSVQKRLVASRRHLMKTGHRHLTA